MRGKRDRGPPGPALGAGSTMMDTSVASTMLAAVTVYSWK